MALSERHMAATFNKPGFELFNHYTYAFCGDGCLQVRNIYLRRPCNAPVALL
jgi:hypothetical protein